MSSYTLTLHANSNMTTEDACTVSDGLLHYGLLKYLDICICFQIFFFCQYGLFIQPLRVSEPEMCPGYYNNNDNNNNNNTFNLYNTFLIPQISLQLQKKKNVLQKLPGSNGSTKWLQTQHTEQSRYRSEWSYTISNIDESTRNTVVHSEWVDTSHMVDHNLGNPTAQDWLWNSASCNFWILTIYCPMSLSTWEWMSCYLFVICYELDCSAIINIMPSDFITFLKPMLKCHHAQIIMKSSVTVNSKCDYLIASALLDWCLLQFVNSGFELSQIWIVIYSKSHHDDLNGSVVKQVYQFINKLYINNYKTQI